MACYYANTDTNATTIPEYDWDWNNYSWAAAEPIVLEDEAAKEEVPEPPPPQFVRERVDEFTPSKPVVPVARNMERQRSPPREKR